MGRITEALKRAEQERAWRLEGEPAGIAESAVADRMPAEASNSADAASIVSPPAEQRPFVPHAAPLTPASIDPRVVTLHDPGCAMSERFRSLRTRLLTSNPSGSARLLAMTSSMPREGKTVTAANLAFSLAELRHLRIALIDLDLRQRGLDSLLGAGPRPGLAEVIRGERGLAEICIPLVRPNLHYVPAGDPGSATPGELLTSPRMESLLRELGERFHYGLIDTPPIHTVADIGLIAPLCHSVLMVVRMNVTPEPLVRRCARQLQANGVTVAGAILTGECEESAGGGDTEDYYQAAGGEA